MNENHAPTAWHISESAFKALFYPFPAVFLDTAGPGLVRIDVFSQSIDDAFATPEFIKQSRLLDVEERQVKKMRDEFAQVYESFSSSAAKYSLGEHRLGVVSHHTLVSSDQRFTTVNWAHKKNVTLEHARQALAFFRTADTAAKFGKAQMDWTALADPFVSTHAAAAERVEQRAREYGVQGLNNLHFDVRAGTNMTVTTCNCTVQNVYLQFMANADSEDVLESVALKAIIHLYRQLVHYRSDDLNSLADAPSVLPPDPDMCAYCGTESATRMYCSRCQMLWYCSPECQTKHWKMKGPFSHRRECKLLRDPSVVPSAIPMGRLVMIHSLNSAAGQCLNGKDAIVVMPPTDNGRLGVVLVDDVSKEDIERLKMGNVSWVPTELKKAIKTENLELVWTEKRL